MRLSLEMGVPVDRLKSEVTSTQFLEYVEVLNRRWNERSKLDHQLAEILYELYLTTCAVRGEKPAKSLEDCYQKFKLVDKVEEKPSDPMSQVAKSKMAWMAATGYKRGKSRRKAEEVVHPVQVPLAKDRRSKFRGKK